MWNHALDAWTAAYSNHATLRTSIVFLHIAGLVGGGGAAIVEDRAVLRIRGADQITRHRQLRQLKGTHGVVILGLAVTAVSGLLLFAADVDTFLYSKCFWIKMGLIALLLINGVFLVRTERLAEQGHDVAWSRLTYSATTSVVLWTLTTLAGAALPNI